MASLGEGSGWSYFCDNHDEILCMQKEKGWTWWLMYRQDSLIRAWIYGKSICMDVYGKVTTYHNGMVSIMQWKVICDDNNVMAECRGKWYVIKVFGYVFRRWVGVTGGTKVAAWWPSRSQDCTRSWYHVESLNTVRITLLFMQYL